MKNKEFYKLLKKSQSNSGFTLTELLVGLIMSIFVIGALGFGLMTVLTTSQRENSKVTARTENSRALDFISDEVRRARTIETNATNAPRFTISGATVVLALDIPLVNDDVTLGTDSNATVKDERVVYYLKSNSGTNWKGPQVLYRWGPPLNANGEYSPKTGGTTNHWTEQALIDGINNTTVSSPCATGTVTPANPTGFYACITGTNTAQLFLTGQTKTASGRYDDTQTNDSQVVARARETLAYKTDKNDSITWSVEGLGGEFGCSGSRTWDMRTDFGNDSTRPDNTTKWIKNRDGSKQPQPIEIDSTKPLTITSSAVGATGCDNDDRGNPGIDNQNEALSTYTQKISHTINFGNPITFNGDQDGGTYNQPKVRTPDEAVQFLKKGYSIPTIYGGYDANGDGDFNDPGDQPSLGKFLYSKGLAIIDPANITTGTNTEILNNPSTKFLIPTYEQLAASSLTTTQKSAFKLLGDDQRIIAIEVGQIYSDKKNDGTAITGNKNPGFDLQDNIFVVTSDVFKKKFNSNCFPSGCPSTNTNTDTNNTGTGANTGN
jgi:hypothetical protein